MEQRPCVPVTRRRGHASELVQGKPATRRSGRHIAGIAAHSSAIRDRLSGLAADRLGLLRSLVPLLPLRGHHSGKTRCGPLLGFSAGRPSGSASNWAGRCAHGVRLGSPSLLPVEVVARIVAERDAGATWQKIADGLIADAVSTAQGDARWYPASVRKVYIGQDAAALRPSSPPNAAAATGATGQAGAGSGAGLPPTSELG